MCLTPHPRWRFLHILVPTDVQSVQYMLTKVWHVCRDQNLQVWPDQRPTLQVVELPVTSLGFANLCVWSMILDDPDWEPRKETGTQVILANSCTEALAGN
jgi:hypothetical protein